MHTNSPVNDASSIKTNDSLDSLSSGTIKELDNLNLAADRPPREMASSFSFTMDAEQDDSEPITVSPLFPSRFPNIPPTIYFATAKEKVRSLPVSIRRHLKWRLSTITPILVRQTVLRSGYRIVRDVPDENGNESNDWSGIWGKHMKSTAFRTVQDYQKVNHFPGSFHFGRKDKLWQNVSRMVSRHGRAFNFIPETYILPQDAKNLRNAWERSNTRRNWIIKPPASARGTGVHVIHKWSQIPKKQPVVVQRYLSTPYLINDTKFDLRLYVLMTSFDPLRIFVFDDGLVRFASVKYSKAQQSLSDRFMHLTNYSINKRSASYTSNEDENICQGHKWSLKALWRYFDEQGVDTQALWNSLTDVIVKTIISCESNIWKLIKAHTRSRYCCFELFGFDILLDKNLRPWLLEVNISPSLHSSSLLDTNIKGNLVKDMLNIAGYQVPNRVGNFSLQTSLLRRFGISSKQTKSLCMNKMLHRWKKSPEEKEKHLKYEKGTPLDAHTILDNLTPDDVRILIECEDEFVRKGNFVRVFPTENTHFYHQYFEINHYYNTLLDIWERKYYTDRTEGLKILQGLAKSGYHLKVHSQENLTKVEKGSEEAKSTIRIGDGMAGGDKLSLEEVNNALEVLPSNHPTNTERSSSANSSKSDIIKHINANPDRLVEKIPPSTKTKLYPPKKSDQSDLSSQTQTRPMNDKSFEELSTDSTDDKQILEKRTSNSKIRIHTRPSIHTAEKRIYAAPLRQDSRKQITSSIEHSIDKQLTLSKSKLVPLRRPEKNIRSSEMTPHSQGRPMVNNSKYISKHNKKPLIPALVIWNGGWVTVQPKVPLPQ